MINPDMARSQEATQILQQESNEPKDRTKVRYSTLDGQQHVWQTGAWKRLPYLGLLSLLGVLLCIGFNIAILLTCNGQSVSKWSVQPSVLLAISAALSNGLLKFAMAEGAAISWWLRAIDGCTVDDLHCYWSFPNSLYDAARNIRVANLLTFASVASVLVAVDSPLYQRALTIVTDTVAHQTPLSVKIARQIPEGYTGTLMQHTTPPALGSMKPAFQQVMEGYNSRETMYINSTVGGSSDSGNFTGLTIRAAGFAVDCAQETRPWDFGPAYETKNGSLTSNDSSDIVGMVDVERTMFQTNFTFDATLPSNITFTAVWKDQIPCVSRLQVKRCRFQIAELYYPVTVVNNTVEFAGALDELGLSAESIAARYEIDSNEVTQRNGSTLGGIYLGAEDLLNAQAAADQADHIWSLDTSGTLAQDYANNSDLTTTCQSTWSDPTSAVISTLQEIMFRTALAAANDSSRLEYYKGVDATRVQTNQTVNSVLTTEEVVFKLHPEYLAVGVLVTIACVIPVASTFYGWWKIGRPVTMSPIEIAKAFNAPVLRGSATGSDLQGLLPVVGRRRVRYGAVRYRGEKVVFPEEGSEEEEGGVETRLELAHLHWTSVPEQGAHFA
ncbi:hypothetical protein BO86DRAFT_441396 [Aspergillus japonicus CBS 114.51]|uniref:Uncharacterized protein n=1 Tax=Aspergillus japonicus CBS 114.51 TaxID=1448312 RepID=A0A8T8X9N1_ASPJA|nr:hypothetical protein BO86DRAFT_441396 [Aspergillus japonicus CBS 114.51]RAH84574.1 hypothetical protein BO86DRAFT_441396 [Aspergillus japonicus CBS 114.51]